MKSDNLIHLGYIDITALFIEWSCVVAIVTSTVFKLSKKIGKDILGNSLPWFVRLSHQLSIFKHCISACATSPKFSGWVFLYLISLFCVDKCPKHHFDFDSF